MERLVSTVLIAMPDSFTVAAVPAGTVADVALPATSCAARLDDAFVVAATLLRVPPVPRVDAISVPPKGLLARVHVAIRFSCSRHVGMVPTWNTQLRRPAPVSNVY